MSSKTPLMLLHGVTMSSAAWDDVVPHLADDFDLIVPTLPGHRGGPAAPDVSFDDLVDFAESVLDEHGLETAHLAGNSLGGWISLELARRGRAASVCALSPAGFWPEGNPDATGVVTTLRRAVRLAQLTSFLAPLVVATGLGRKLAMGMMAEHADRLSAHQAVEDLRDAVGCEAAPSLFKATGYCAPMDPLSCPVTLAWSAKDRIFPPARYGAVARERLPGARYIELAGLGHVPMIDDPAGTAATIREVALTRQ